MNARVSRHSASTWFLPTAMVMAIIAVCLAAVNLSAPQPASDARTVGEAFEGVAQKNSNAEHLHPGAQSGDRLVELASALGLPESSVPDNIFVPLIDQESKRNQLRQDLEDAVNAGVFTHNEANAVLTAFDLGYIQYPDSVSSVTEMTNIPTPPPNG